MIYVIITSFLFFLRYVLKKDNLARNQIYYIILLLLFLFSSFRYQIGCDWSGYYYMFLKTKNYEWSQINSSNIDIFSFAIFYLIHKLGLSYPYVNIIYGLVFFIGVHVLARRQLDPLGFLVLLFPILIINMPMSGMRQAAAIGVICIALSSFIDRRPGIFLFWVIIAIGFHSSAIIFLILLPFINGRYNNTRIIFSIFLFIPGLIFVLLTGTAQNAFKAYIISERESYGALFRVSSLMLSGLYFFIFVKKKWKRFFPKDYNIINLGSLGMILLIMLVPISTTISDRFGYYFIPIQAMIFARLPFFSFGLSQLLNTALPYVFLFILFITWTLTSVHFEKCYTPYNTWIFGIFGRDLLKTPIIESYIN